MTSQPYWSVDIPGLGEQQADELTRYAEEQLDLRGSSINPDLFLTMHVDRDTVQAMALAMSSSSHEPIVGAVLESMTEWLGSAHGL